MKAIYKNQLCFLYTNKELSEQEIEEAISFAVAPKTIVNTVVLSLPTSSTQKWQLPDPGDRYKEQLCLRGSRLQCHLHFNRRGQEVQNSNPQEHISNN